MKKILVLAVLIAMVTVTSVIAQNAAAGKTLYIKECQTCHAATGRGNAAMAKQKKIDIKPINTDEVAKKSDAELKKIITDGGKQMEAIKGLSAAELDNVVAYVRSLKK